ncbi:MAG: hypothetical protein KUG77_12335 [Nannocystaceae bacterium]|nr:hypothetical protein [Nannocystaceae bacterium]
MIPPDIGEKVVPETIAVLLRIKAGQKNALHAQLEQHVFEHPVGEVHYLRMLPIDDSTLLVSAVFDADLNALLNLMAENAVRLDAVLRHTEGYPTGGAADSAAMRDFLRHNESPTLMLYSAFDRASEPAVRDATPLRLAFLEFVKAVQRAPGSAAASYSAFLNDNGARIDTHSDGAADELSAAALSAPDRQNPFTMVFDIREDWVKRLDKTLKDGEWFLDHLDIHPLKQIPTVHYARFAKVTRTKVLFESVYDGEWEQYVSDFAVHIPKKLDLVWGGAVGYPVGGAADAPALAKFLADRRLPRDYFYMSYSNQTVKEIQKSLALGKKLILFTREAPSGGERLVKHVERFIHRNQALLA